MTLSDELFPRPTPEALATLDALDADVAELNTELNADRATWTRRISDLAAKVAALSGTAQDNYTNLAARVAALEGTTPPPPPPPVPIGPSGFPMPTTDPAGMTRVFADDFTAYPNVPLGQFPAATNGKWSGYPNTYLDTSKNGHYNLGKTCSIVDGVLDIHLWSETINGVQYNYSAAPYPLIPGNQPTGVINGVDYGTGGAVRANLYYGQIEFAFRCAQPAVGWKTAWLLWPDKGTNTKDAFGNPGGYGEIDFPEGNLDGAVTALISGFHHRDGATLGSDQDVRNTGVKYADPAHTWHKARIVWKPDLCEFWLDDVKVGASIMARVDRMPMHWIFQTETRLSGGPPPAGSEGRMQIDWVVMHQLDGVYPA